MRQLGLVAIAAALLFAQPARAQSRPASANASEAEPQASTAAATQPASQSELPPASARSVSTARATKVDKSAIAPWKDKKIEAAPAHGFWPPNNLSLWIVGGLLSGMGLVSALGFILPLALASGQDGTMRTTSETVGSILSISMLVALGDGSLAPLAVAFASAMDSTRTGCAWWPPVLGAALGWVELAGVVASVFWFAQGSPWVLLTPGACAVLVAGCALSPVTAFCGALGGVLVAEMLLQPKPETQASESWTVGVE